MKAKLLKSAFLPKAFRIICEASIEPQKWNGMTTKCSNRALIMLNDKSYCKKHAGVELVNYYISEEMKKSENF